jgi:hypothetical protein
MLFEKAPGSITPSDRLIFIARNQKLLEEVNSGFYMIQLKEMITSIYSPLDSYFLQHYGFTAQDVLDFQDKIIHRVERLFNQKLKHFSNAVRQTKLELEDIEKGKELRDMHKANGIQAEEMLRAYGNYSFTNNTKEIFTFYVDQFCVDEGINDKDRFCEYINAISCRLGEQDSGFTSPLDYNILFSKPIIQLEDDRFFCPIADLLTNLHVVLPKLLEEEKAQQTKVCEKFLYLRATFTEKKIGESLGAIFDKKKILQNLFYEFQGQRYETDTLIPYDNKIILIEAKSGFFSEPAKRGGIMSLKKDLQNLIHSAFEQSSRTMRYIKSTENAVFTDESGREIYKIEMACEKMEFYLINVTLEPLRFFFN